MVLLIDKKLKFHYIRGMKSDLILSARALIKEMEDQDIKLGTSLPLNISEDAPYELFQRAPANGFTPRIYMTTVETSD